MTPAVARLEPEERGVLLVALLGAGAAPLAALVGPARARCEAAWDELQRAGRKARTDAAALLLHELAQPLPVGLEALHPSWIASVAADAPPALARALLDGLPPPLRAGARLPAPDDATAADVAAALPPWLRPALARTLFAPLAELLEEVAGPVARALCALEPDALLDEVERRGAEALGACLAGAPPEAQARALAGVGSRLAPVVRAVMAAPPEPAACAEARRDVAAASREPAEAVVDRLRAIGLRALARTLVAEGDAALRRIAGRLPHDLGRRLLACGAEGETHASGRSAMNEGTRWDAS